MIIIERDAVLCLMNREGPSISLPEILSELPKTLTSSTASSPSATTDDRIRNPLTPAPRVILRGSSPISLPDLCPVELVPCSDDEESDLEDDASCATVSTSSLSGDRRQGVTWSTHLVTEVKTRPRTLPEDVRDLFYTYEETQRWDLLGWCYFFSEKVSVFGYWCVALPAQSAMAWGRCLAIHCLTKLLACPGQPSICPRLVGATRADSDRSTGRSGRC